MKKVRKLLQSNNMLYNLLLLSATLILLISILGIYLYALSYQTVRSDFYRENESKLVSGAERHESDIQILDDIVMQLSLSDDITGATIEQNPYRVSKLIERLKQYTEISQFFDTILYQYHRDSYICSDRTSMQRKKYLENVCRLEDVTAEEMESLLLTEYFSLDILQEQQVGGNMSGLYLSEAYYTFYFRSIPPEFEETLAFMVPQSYYDQLLKGEPEEKSKQFLVYRDKLILSRGGEALDREELQQFFLEEGITADASAGTIIQKEVSIAQEDYLLSIYKGKSQICYGRIQSLDVLQKKLLTGQRFIIILIIFCLFTGVMMILLFSRKIVAWIKRITSLLDNGNQYDVVNVESGIQEILRVNEVARRENLQQKKSVFVRNFVRGDFVSKEDTVEAGKKAGMNVDFDQYVMVVLRNNAENGNNAFLAIQSMIFEESRVEGYGIHLISNNQDAFLLYGDSVEVLEEVLQRVFDIEKEYDVDSVVAVSNYHTDFAESSKAYLEAELAFDNHLLMDNNRIIRFVEILGREYSGFSAEGYTKQLHYAVRTGNYEAAEEAVKGICSKFKHANASLYSFRILYVDIIHILLKEWGDNEIEFERFYNVFTLSQCRNVQNFYDLLCEMCKVVIERNQGKELPPCDIVQDSIRYMKEHFQKPDLTMNALAEYLGINSVVLAVEFRNAMDLKPSDYLANLRMEKAKELLRTTQMLVGEIAVAVGYEDFHSFTRRFKKYSGMTAQQYRAQQNKGEN